MAAERGTAAQLCEKLKERGVLMMAFAKQKIRAVTHLDASRADVERAAAALSEVAAED